MLLDPDDTSTLPSVPSTVSFPRCLRGVAAIVTFTCLFVAAVVALIGIATSVHKLDMSQPTSSNSASSAVNAAPFKLVATQVGTPGTSGKHILVTGGVGYIGSHTVLHLLQEGHAVTIIDNLVNASPVALERVDELAVPAGARPTFYRVDIRQKDHLEEVFKRHKFDATIHFAGLKAVGESISMPLAYYETNVYGTLNLLQLLDQYDSKAIVFSSSATVYGLAEKCPLAETAPLSATNPYGRTKLVCEELLRDTAAAAVPEGKKPWKIVILRYFNPIGAHPSGRIGEDPAGYPNNLLPFVMQVAVGRRPELSVFGGDYPTADGTALRDYIHVEDLARGHVAALDEGVFGDALQGQSCDVFNLGAGIGVSVLEVVAAAEKATGKKLPYKIVARRAGDVAASFADCSKANRLLKWKVEKSLQDGVNDSWNWQSKNPYGFHPPKEQQQQQEK